MQNNLISRSALLESLIHCDGLGRKSLEAVIKHIKEQPTAYDVEKVVAELENETDCSNCSMYCMDANSCGFDEMRKLAIDIVRNGGKE